MQEPWHPCPDLPDMSDMEGLCQIPVGDSFQPALHVALSAEALRALCRLPQLEVGE